MVNLPSSRQPRPHPVGVIGDAVSLHVGVFAGGRTVKVQPLHAGIVGAVQGWRDEGRFTMTKEQLENKLYERMSAENETFLTDLKAKPVDEIITRSLPEHFSSPPNTPAAQ